MLRLVALVQWLWWASVAAIPVAILAIESYHRRRLGCLDGDCYDPHSPMLLLKLGMLMVATAGLLWPPAFWFLVVAPARALFRRTKRESE